MNLEGEKAGGLSEPKLEVLGKGPEAEVEKKVEEVKKPAAEVLATGGPEAPEVEEEGFGEFGDFGDGQSDQNEGNEGFGDFANFEEAPAEAETPVT